MSKFTGKSDFYDTVFMHYSPEEVMNGKVYVGNSKIDFENDKTNLIPYYPYLIASMASTRDNGKLDLTIYLSNESYIDSQEKESLFFYILQVALACNKLGTNPSVEQLDYYRKSCSNNTYFDSVFAFIVGNDEIKKYLKAIKIKKALNYDSPEAEFIREVVIPKFFYSFHLPFYNNERLELLKEWNENAKEDAFNPLIFKLKNQIADFNKR